MIAIEQFSDKKMSKTVNSVRCYPVGFFCVNCIRAVIYSITGLESSSHTNSGNPNAFLFCSKTMHSDPFHPFQYIQQVCFYLHQKVWFAVSQLKSHFDFDYDHKRSKFACALGSYKATNIWQWDGQIVDYPIHFLPVLPINGDL